MRYVGCKRRLLPFIYNIIEKNNIKGNIFCDLFSGTATVGHYFKQKGYCIISNDLLYSSYVQQKVKITINTIPSFSKLRVHLGINKKNDKLGFAQDIINYLNQLKGVEWFVYQNYSLGGTADKDIKRMYFTDENAKKIDAIREQIEAWKKLKLIDNDEFYILLYALLEEVSKRANTTGTQSSFLKKFYPRALKPLTLNLPTITEGGNHHEAYCEDGLLLIQKLPRVDILYLDPPYTKTQYATAYHLLETVARWDYPILHGITGQREIASLRSTFNSKRSALESLKHIVANGCYCHLMMSYSSDSILAHEEIFHLLSQYGEVMVKRYPLRRYNTLSLTDPRYNPRTHVEERLYYLKPFAANTKCRVKSDANSAISLAA